MYIRTLIHFLNLSLSSVCRPEEQVAFGSGPTDCPLPEVSGIFPQASALYLVAFGDPCHQDCLFLHHHGDSERGETPVCVCVCTYLSNHER